MVGSQRHTMPHLQAVYEEDLVHRMPGDASTLGQFEAGYPAAKAWIGEEQARQESAASCPAQDSFTRVVVGELKPEVLHHIGNASGREQLCRWVKTTSFTFWPADGQCSTHASHLSSPVMCVPCGQRLAASESIRAALSQEPGAPVPLLPAWRARESAGGVPEPQGGGAAHLTRVHCRQECAVAVRPG